MPTVPYKGYFDVTPSVNPAPRIGVNVPGEAFGTGIGRAIEGAGRDISRVGDEFAQATLKRQGDNNEAETREVAADLMVELGEKHAKFNASQGKDAALGYDAYAQDIKDTYKTYRGKLSNPAAQRMFDGYVQPTISRTINAGAIHSGDQAKRWKVETIDAQRKAAAAAPTGDTSNKAFDQSSEALDKLGKERGEALGQSPEKVAEDTREFKNAMVSGRLIAMARTDPAKAREILESVVAERKIILDETTLSKIENAIQIGEAGHGAQQIVSQVTEGMTAETSAVDLGQKIEEARKIARKTSPNNPILEKNAEAGVVNRFNHLQTVKRAESRANEDLVGNFINGGGDPDRAIKDRADLISNDVIYEAFNNLRPEVQNRMLKRIDLNAKMDANLDTDARKANYERLSGMPGAGHVDQFNDINLNAEDLTAEKRKELQKTQNSTRKGAAVDPHVTQTLGDPNVKSMLVEAGLLDREGKPARFDEYNRYSGMLKAEIQNYFQDFGKWPLPEVQHRMAANVLRMAVKKPGWFGREYEESIYKKGIPDEVRPLVIKNLKAKGIEEPTEEDITRQFIRLYHQAHEKEVSGGKK